MATIEKPKLSATDFYLRARRLNSAYTSEHTEKAQQLLQRALALDSNHARAMAFYGYTYILQWKHGWGDTPQCLENALRFVHLAIEMDPTDYFPRWKLSMVYKHMRDHDKCMNECDRAIVLCAVDDRDDFVEDLCDILVERAETLVYLGDEVAAANQIQRAIANHPSPPHWYFWDLAWAYTQCERYQESQEQLAMIKNPHNDIRLLVAANLAGMGMKQEAQDEISQFMHRSIEYKPGQNAPVWSIDQERRAGAFRNQSDEDRYLNKLHAAGLPAD